MRVSDITVLKHPFRLNPDSSRVIVRMIVLTPERMQRVIERVKAIPDNEVEDQCERLLEDYGRRHRDVQDAFLRHYSAAIQQIGDQGELSERRQLLVGAYFTMEYSIESVALFNPSIVADRDQSNLPEGHMRVIISLRAVGEGHISSIEFRRGVLDSTNNFTMDPISRFVAAARVSPDDLYDKHLFDRKLLDMTLSWKHSALDAAIAIAGQDIISGVMGKLGDHFTLDQLRWAMGEFRAQDEGREEVLNEVLSRMELLARSNYEIRFSPHSDISERVLFPVTPAQAGGIEDARFVHFTHEDGAQTFYATYTAFDGQHILTQLLETDDFRHFKVHTLNGLFAQSKGMALFPRKVNGRFAMISRIDGEHLYLMYSDNIHFWDSAQRLDYPMRTWGLLQVGNCGSPIETEAGWLLLTHGVGPMRCYSIGVVLLDRDDPSKIIGELEHPLLAPDEQEREGYVPNVVYSCGAMLHNGELVIPYAISDLASRIATVRLDDLLTALSAPKSQSAVTALH